MDFYPIYHPSPTKIIKCLILPEQETGDQFQLGLDSNPTHQPSPAKKNKMLIIQLLMISQKNKMLVFGLRSTSDNRLSKPSKKCWPKHKKNKKGPLRHQKIKCSFLDYVQILMISQAIRAKNVDQTQKNKKGPLIHRKIKCSFLDNIQLLMIGQVIWAKNVDQKVKKQKRPPKLSK